MNDLSLHVRCQGLWVVSKRLAAIGRDFQDCTSWDVSIGAEDSTDARVGVIFASVRLRDFRVYVHDARLAVLVDRRNPCLVFTPLSWGEIFWELEVDLIALRMWTSSENSVFPDPVPVLEVCAVTQYRCLLPSDDLLSDLQA